MRASSVLALALLATASVAAVGQSKLAAPSNNADVPEQAPTQLLERPGTEDDSTRVSELRIGGETRRITVQPKNGAPAYQVQPASGRSPLPPAAEAGPGASGPRTWTVLQF